MPETNEESDRCDEMARLVNEGKDDWIDFNIDNHAVRTTAIFVKSYQDLLPVWVREFIAQQAKVHEYGTNVEVESWHKEHDGEVICQFRITDPRHNHPVIIIDTYNKLMEKGVIKRTIKEGQHKGKI